MLVLYTLYFPKIDIDMKNKTPNYLEDFIPKENISEYILGLLSQNKLPRDWNRILLESIDILNDGRLKEAKKIAKLLVFKKKIANHELARCIQPQIRVTDKKLKLRKMDYEKNKNEFDKQIKNKFRTLNKIWKELGFKARYSPYFSYLEQK